MSYVWADPSSKDCIGKDDERPSLAGAIFLVVLIVAALSFWKGQ